MASSLQVLDSWIEKYGKVFGIYLAEKPYLVVTDADIVQECFVKQADVFQDRPQFTLDLEPFSSSLVLLKGEYQSRQYIVINRLLGDEQLWYFILLSKM